MIIEALATHHQIRRFKMAAKDDLSCHVKALAKTASDGPIGIHPLTIRSISDYIEEIAVDLIANTLAYAGKGR